MMKHFNFIDSVFQFITKDGPISVTSTRMIWPLTKISLHEPIRGYSGDGAILFSL